MFDFMEVILESALAFFIVALLVAVAAVVLAFIFIVPEKKRPRLNKIGQLAHDIVNFKFLIIEKIVQALYIFNTAFIFTLGFMLLFPISVRVFGHSSVFWYGGYGILLMIFGPIFVRIVYEVAMLSLLSVKNIISINNKLKNQNEGAGNNPFAAIDFSAYKSAPRQPQPQNNAQYYQPQPQQNNGPRMVYCPNCGSVAEAGTFCAKCGTRV